MSKSIFNIVDKDNKSIISGKLTLLRSCSDGDFVVYLNDVRTNDTSYPQWLKDCVTSCCHTKSGGKDYIPEEINYYVFNNKPELGYEILIVENNGHGRH